MEVIRLNGENINECAAQAAGVLHAGGIVLYPTDTVYGLGSDAFSDTAVAKVYDIKKRDGKKPMHCVVGDLTMAERYVELNERARALAEKFFPGALTLILKKKEGNDSGIAAGMTTIGIRIPNNAFCSALAREFGRPYTTTSANVSGAPAARRIDEILAQIGADAQKIDLIVDAGELPESKPSTVVDLSGAEPRILREGAISVAEIRAFFI